MKGAFGLKDYDMIANIIQFSLANTKTAITGGYLQCFVLINSGRSGQRRG